ncbi:MAG: CDP-alcohol phosphatidyltransferase family protein [Actinomycetota bacterium]
MLNKFLRGVVTRIINRPARALISMGVSPNALTVTGFFLLVGACGLIATGRLVEGGWALLVAGAFDLFDGAVAKLGGKASKRGAFLDSTLDRLSDAMLFGAIIWQFLKMPPSLPPDSVLYQFPEFANGAQTGGAALAFGALVLGFLVSYIKARAEGLGMDCNVGVAERAERIVLPALGLVFDQLIPALVILVALSAVTAVQRFVHVWKQA